MNKPYDDVVIEENHFIRTIDNTADNSEMVWHRDRADRKVIALEGDEWYLQMDNEMPQLIELNKPIHIKKGVYHRVIRGKQKLKLEIWESNHDKI
jgi:hypothetical protein